MNFTTLQGLTIPEGVVTQITDASGRVIWAVKSGGKPIILEVEKITSNTYANETTYENEEFILLQISLKNKGTIDNPIYGTASITYGGLTKTITSSSTVFFGTFGGVSDSVETPASGELVIEGDYYSVSVDFFNKSKSSTTYCGCVTAIKEWGCATYGGIFRNCAGLTSVTISDRITAFNNGAFKDCTNLTSVTFGRGLKSIGYEMFSGCSALPSLIIPSCVTSINTYAFRNCTSLTSITIPDSVTSISSRAFDGCTGLTSITFDNTSGWYVTQTNGGDISTGTAVNVTDAVNNVTLITNTYIGYYWYRA